ncbi:hypothetical protein LXA19_18030, partial [Erwinia amylovora]|uniref:hypothetical protein n=1 Tax=Erwinia amylovora TaxID=552 RepID=UPI0020BDD84F
MIQHAVFPPWVGQLGKPSPAAAERQTPAVTKADGLKSAHKGSKGVSKNNDPYVAGAEPPSR